MREAEAHTSHLSLLSLLGLGFGEAASDQSDPLGALLHQILHGLGHELRGHNDDGALNLVVHVLHGLVDGLSEHLTAYGMREGARRQYPWDSRKTHLRDTSR